MKTLTSKLATEVRHISLEQLKGLVKDLIGDAGTQASAKDFMHLVLAQKELNVYTKVLFVLKDEGPVKQFALTKTGPVYSFSMENVKGGEFHSSGAWSLIHMVEKYEVLETATCDESEYRSKNLNKLCKAMSKAIKKHGKNTTISQVFRELQPNTRMGVGRYMLKLPKASAVYINGFLGTMIAEVVDGNSFKNSCTKAHDLIELIGKDVYYGIVNPMMFNQKADVKDPGDVDWGFPAAKSDESAEIAAKAVQ